MRHDAEPARGRSARSTWHSLAVRDGDVLRDGFGHLAVRPGAKALLTADDGRVVMVRERRDDGTTFWTLPGGGLRPGEAPIRGLHRELAEELQCAVELGDRVTSCTYRHVSRTDVVSVYAVFRGRLAGEPVPNRGEGIVEHRLVAPPAVPQGTLPPFEAVVAAFGRDEQPTGDASEALDSTEWPIRS